MFSSSYTGTVLGVDGVLVSVECNSCNRLAKFEIVGLPDNAVSEAKDRVRSATLNSGYKFPDFEIIVNLAPANLKKEGSSFDLAILISILKSTKTVLPTVSLEDKCFIGELSLSGKIKPTNGVLPMALCAKEKGIREIYVAKENAQEASLVEGLTVYAPEDVRYLIDHLNGFAPLSPFVPSTNDFPSEESLLDFADVKGQERAKRAVEIASAGGHNLLLIGPPGSGKSMLAKRIPSILPKMTYEESMETTKIHSVSGILKENTPFVTTRPFRAPHHSMSMVAMTGGGRIPTPGEVSLAHNGVLFLDEFPEYHKDVTESLRQPLEDGKITVTRVSGRLTFPSSFMLVCAMNPCKCGYYGHPTHPCKCKPNDIKRYVSKISGPLLDRIDLQIEVPALAYEEISQNEKAESSAQIRARVEKARQIAQKRFENELGENGLPITCNAQMGATQIQKYCTLDGVGKKMMQNAFDSLGLSARGHDRILKLARTIADLGGKEQIDAPSLAEAISLRTLDKKYF